jgi:hypothetical protein
MTERMNGVDPGLMDVDRLLHDFYRAEMPDPWPRLALPSRAPARPAAPRFARSFFRLALAASIVLGLLAFWGVRGLFPEDVATGIGVTGPEIGKKLNHRMSPVDYVHTPSGDAQIFEEGLPNGQSQVINVIGPSNSKAPR